VTRDPNASSELETKPSKWVMAAIVFVRVIYALLSVGIIVTILASSHTGWGPLATLDLAGFIDRHGPAVVGIPVAGFFALLLVSLARALDGPMALDFIGLRSEGASATCIVWAILFLAISLSFRALW
jgi:hypothetical protein